MAERSATVEASKTRRNLLRKKCAVSAGAFALLILHVHTNLLPEDKDQLGIALLVIAALPWIFGAMPLSEIEMVGVKVRLRDVVDEQKSQGALLASHDKVINDLVTYSMSASIFRHLSGIGLLKVYNYDDNWSNRREFYFLRDNGFIRPKAGSFLEFDGQTPRNLCSISEPTPIGWLSIKLRQQEIPSDWLMPETRPNLAVDPATL